MRLPAQSDCVKCAIPQFPELRETLSMAAGTAA
jgi:hypothetical protein